ncbi:MAG: hypothetical protein GWN87_30095, partial [Desulfuromonadales bacterium]|nr:hypothetical protein [Desulfuromonadales bacterium]
MTDVVYQPGEKWRLVDPEQFDAFEQWIFFDGAYDGSYWYVAGANAIGLQGRIRRAGKDTIYGNAAAFSAVNPSPASGPIQGIAYGGGELVAVTQNGQAVSSFDGTTWAITAVGGSPDLRRIDYGEVLPSGNKFCACANNGIWLRNGTWAQVDSQAVNWWRIRHIEFVAWVVVGYDASNNGRVATGTGNSWNTAATVTTGVRTLSINTLGASKWVIGGVGGYVGVASSPTGTYTDRSIVGETDDIFEVIGLEPTTIIAVSTGGKIYRSINEGVNWALVEGALLSASNGYLGAFLAPVSPAEIIAYGAPEGGIVHSFQETQTDETDKET